MLPVEGEVWPSTGDEPAGHLRLVIEHPTSQNGGQIKRDLKYRLKSIKSYLKGQRTEIGIWNEKLPAKVREFVKQRREGLKRLAAVVETLNIPLGRRPGAPDVANIPIKRRLVRPLPPAPSRSQEWAIRDEDYEHILRIIRHEGRSFERTPKTFAVHDEEGLRDIIVAHLNGHYEGEAKAEAFSVKGKTDILIERENRAAFIAECKVWRGPKELKDAVDQLLGYGHILLPDEGI